MKLKDAVPGRRVVVKGTAAYGYVLDASKDGWVRVHFNSGRTDTIHQRKLQVAENGENP